MNNTEVQKAVANMLNSFGPANSKEFIKAMQNEHRTLQQNFTRLRS